MIQALVSERHRGVTPRAEVSRRTVLRGLAATVAAATGLARAGQVFANPDAAVTPFRYRAPASALEDLKRRLARTRWPEPETVADWSQGVPITKLKALVEYWRTGYDWRRCEARLNGFPQYRTEIDGLGIHFLHVRSREANALPILITHGWPGSVIEFFKIIEPLTNPTAHGGRAEDAFHVVAPSLPGFAFSDKPAERGWNNARIARAWAELVRRLGYSRYVAQGGRLGRFHHHDHGTAATGGARWDSSQFSADASRSDPDAGPVRRRTGGGRSCPRSSRWRTGRAHPCAGDAAADRRLCFGGFAGRAGRLDLQYSPGRDRQRRRSRIGADTRRNTQRDHALLADQHGGLFRAPLL